jgi:hypothetical protein
MVLLKPTLAGTVLLILGILLITVLGQYVTAEVQQTQRRDVEPHVGLLIGDTADRPYTLPAGVQVFGTILATQAPSNESGEIHFIVLDNENYQRWSTSGQGDFAYSVDNRGQFNYTFTTNKSGIFHFVFDNRASLYKKYVVLTVAYNEVLTSKVADKRVVPIGWGLMISGALVAIYGLVRKARVPWDGAS